MIAVITYWKSVYQAKYQEYFSYRVRRRIFRKIILADWGLLNSKSKHNHLQVLDLRFASSRMTLGACDRGCEKIKKVLLFFH
jgi:hypothetical protein